MIRSLFFAPANRADLIGKLARFGADCHVIDLEDGTPPHEKDSARATVVGSVATVRAGNYPGKILIRVNEPRSEHYLRDLQVALDADVDGIVIPKLETREQLFPALHIINQLACSDADGRRKIICGGIETVKGVVNAVAVCGCDSSLTMVYFGAEDFATDIGGRRTSSGDEVLYARSQVVLAAKAAGIIAIDQGVAEIRDDELYRRDAEAGRNLGYSGKICVIPKQIALCHEVFSPSSAEVDAAKRLVSAYTKATAANVGTIDFEGKMVDGPLLKRAQSVLAMSERVVSGAKT